LSEKRQKLIVAAAKRLAEVGMIIFNQQTESLSITERGRIAARYYIKNTSIEIIGKDLKASMSEADVLGMLSTCSEVKHI
jgi:antiviral helicase SLH1